MSSGSLHRGNGREFGRRRSRRFDSGKPSWLPRCTASREAFRQRASRTRSALQKQKVEKVTTETDETVPGYIFVAVQFAGGTNGIFRIQWEGDERPSYDEMFDETHSIGFHSDTFDGPLLFLGSKLKADGTWTAESWVKIPTNNLNFATWEYLSTEEIEAQSKANREKFGNRDGAQAWAQEREGEEVPS